MEHDTNGPKLVNTFSCCDVLRRMQKDYILKYELPNGVSYADHGRLFRHRVDKRNPLDENNGVVFDYPHIFKKPTQAEMATHNIQVVNLFSPIETLLPQFDVRDLQSVTIGPYQVRLSQGYLTDMRVSGSLSYVWVVTALINKHH